MAESQADWVEAPSEEPDEYFVVEHAGEQQRLTRHHGDADAARTHAAASGGKLFRGRTEVVRESLQEIPLNADDAY